MHSRCRVWAGGEEVAPTHSVRALAARRQAQWTATRGSADRRAGENGLQQQQWRSVPHVQNDRRHKMVGPTGASWCRSKACPSGVTNATKMVDLHQRCVVTESS